MQIDISTIKRGAIVCNTCEIILKYEHQYEANEQFIVPANSIGLVTYVFPDGTLQVKFKEHGIFNLHHSQLILLPD